MKQQLTLVYLAMRHPRCPWHVRLLGLLVVGYALSPIDLIPDFIPVLGYLDDLLIVPAGLWLCLRLMPADVLSECREQAAALDRKRLPQSYGAAAFIALLWTVGLAGAVWHFELDKWVANKLAAGGSLGEN